MRFVSIWMVGCSCLLLVLLLLPEDTFAFYHRSRRRPLPVSPHLRHPQLNRGFHDHHLHRHQQQQRQQQQRFYRRSRQLLTPPLPPAPPPPPAHQDGRVFESRRLHTIDNPHAIRVHHRDESEEEQLRRIRLTLFLTQLQNQAAVAGQQQHHQLVLTDASANELRHVPDEYDDVDDYDDGDEDRDRRDRDRRRRRKSKLKERQSPGCPGFCTNMLSCMLHGGRTMRKSPSQGCSGMLEVCCSDGRQPRGQQRRRRRRKQRQRRRRRRRRKLRGGGGGRGSHGRSLPHPLDSISYSSVPRPAAPAPPPPPPQPRPPQPQPSPLRKRKRKHHGGHLGSSSVEAGGGGASREALFNLVDGSAELLGDGCGVSRLRNVVADRRIMGGLDAGYGQVLQ